MRIRNFNRVIGLIGWLVVIVGPTIIGFSITNFLLLLAGVTVFELLTMYAYRKHRFRKNKCKAAS